ncbi:MAG TPA: phospholipase D-like domain-containing protein [Pyrinomonadaceae bacterium]|nr:phospholipase D-like domain-containing protein [Pyrinomonadaceae bacterium]
MANPNSKDGFSVRAYQGDAKTLLAFNLPKAKAKNLAGFTLEATPKGQKSFFISNFLRYEDPSKHAQDGKLPPTSSFNAPIHKFRWVHVPGSLQQGTKPFFGMYTYTVTPRYFDGKGSMLPIDPNLSVAVAVNVGPFAKGSVEAGFTRGYTQSQAFVHHFGPKVVVRPSEKDLIFDTSQVAGKNNDGEEYTFAEEYDWLGFTARQRIFEIANEVLKNKKLRLDVFAYDLNEPDLMAILLKLAKQGRVRVILDNAPLHHASKPKKGAKKAAKKSSKTAKAKPKSAPPEDQFEKLFVKAAKKPAEIKRGKFGRFAHDKVLIVSNAKGATKVLTGSTNFSVTGLYVNSNHILVFNDAKVAGTYADIFKIVWDGDVKLSFNKTPEAAKTFSFSGKGLPKTEITFSPHVEEVAKKNLEEITTRVGAEKKVKKEGSVLFAVMGLDKASGTLLPALQKLHKDQNIFSYGVSDSPGGIQLYKPGTKTGVLVTGKPGKSQLPPPFDQVPGVGLGHQIHHKFVVCGFNGAKPVVYCGSSNLAEKGEQVNGDNLIAIHDGDIAAVFAIDALLLIDHFAFLNRSASKANKPATQVKSASKADQAAKAGWFLSTTDKWVEPYFDSNDLHSVDRELFGD